MLEAPFFEEEVKEAVFGSYAEGAPGPHGFSFIFYQTFWETIKGDLMALVNCFKQNSLNLDRLNFAMITLLPKEPDAKTLKKFRPISLINCSFKIFAKMLNNRLIKVASKLIASNQTTFVKGRYILESVVAAHKIIHEVHRKKESGIILKLDYEKAYGSRWRGWIEKMVKGGPSVSGLMMKIVPSSNRGKG